MVYFLQTGVLVEGGVFWVSPGIKFEVVQAFCLKISFGSIENGRRV